ncbi:hypothetical protein KAF44_26665 (plasmid) [Cupriavidus necator]|nr:hypothetical protein KAF44_26665 [Cupriavidus necator]
MPVDGGAAVANALNALSKWPGEDEARDAALRLAERVSSEPQLCQSMEARAVANALNALSKWPGKTRPATPRCGWPSALARNPSCASRWTRRP